MTFYIADLHLGHKNVLRFDNRPFSTIEENDEYMYVCRVNGTQPYHLRKVRTQNEFGKFYDGVRHSVPGLLFACRRFCQSVLGLIGCIVCGFSVGIMWPGSISIASSKIPLGGTGLFAFLAMAGDLGASIGPAAIGVITQNAGDNMKAGMLAACVFPVILIVSLCLLKYIRLKK